jgi:hypothetical protein
MVQDVAVEIECFMYLFERKAQYLYNYPIYQLMIHINDLNYIQESITKFL